MTEKYTQNQRHGPGFVYMFASACVASFKYVNIQGKMYNQHSRFSQTGSYEKNYLAQCSTSDEF